MLLCTVVVCSSSFIFLFGDKRSFFLKNSHLLKFLHHKKMTLIISFSLHLAWYLYLTWCAQLSCPDDRCTPFNYIYITVVACAEHQHVLSNPSKYSLLCSHLKTLCNYHVDAMLWLWLMQDEVLNLPIPVQGHFFY